MSTAPPSQPVPVLSDTSLGAPAAGARNGSAAVPGQPRPAPAGEATAAPMPEPMANWLTGRLSASTWVMLGILAVGFFTLFHHWFYVQNRLAMGRAADWGHVYAVPFISAYLIFQRRHALAALAPKVFWPGLAPMLLGIVCYSLFLIHPAAYLHMGQGFAMILTLFGLVLFLAGPKVMTYLFLPIGYLVFGVTVSDSIMLSLTARLQLIASQGSYLALNLMGITTDLAGVTLTVIDSQGNAHPLNVAEACSGMRMLVAFLALGVAVALVACKHWWQRVALVALAIPVALLVNIARVVVLGIASLYDPDLAAGEAHTFIGTLLLIPGFFLYMLLVWVLKNAVRDDGGAAQPANGGKGSGSTEKTSAPKIRPLPTRSDWRRLAAPAFVTSAGLLLGVAAGLGTLISLAGIYLNKKEIHAPNNLQVSAVSPELPSWTRIGEDHRESAAMVEELGTQNYLTRAYRSRENWGDTGQPLVLTLHLAYYTGMIGAVPHVPERCMVGGGWQNLGEAGAVPLPLDRSNWQRDPFVEGPKAQRVFTARLPHDGRFTGGSPGSRVRLPFDPEDIRMRVSKFGEPRSGLSQHAGYFFIANGGWVASAEDVRLLAFNLEDDYAYYLKVQVSSTMAKDAEEFAAQAAALLNEALPEIMRCVPDWIEVQAGDYPADNPRGRRAEGGAGGRR